MFLSKLGMVVLSVGLSALIGLYAFFGMKGGPEERRMITLPKPKQRSEVSVEESIARRRSIRTYAKSPLTLEEVSQLLWAAQGITHQGYGFRSAPSAGATYPLETYVVVSEGGVVGLDAGIYHYIPKEHKLELTYGGDIHRDLMKAALGQSWVGSAPINIVFSAIYERTTRRYGDRGIRYVHMEAGHAAENVYLQAVSLGLGTVVIGAFYDEEVREVLRLGGNESPLYIMPVGRRR